MIIAWLLALAVGAFAGHTLSQRSSRRHWEQVLEQRQAALREELNEANRQLQALRQENADLRYKLGESEKNRRYLESRTRQNPSERGGDESSS